MKKLAKVLMIAAPAFVLAACSSKDSNTSVKMVEPKFGGLSIQDLQSRYNTIYFDFDSYEISSQDQNLLDAHAAYLISANGQVTIAGHADERGTPEYNFALGERRANAVKEYLVYRGATTNIATVSYGEEKPAVLGHTEADYQKNRRAVLEY